MLAQTKSLWLALCRFLSAARKRVEIAQKQGPCPTTKSIDDMKRSLLALRVLHGLKPGRNEGCLFWGRSF
jgi:hypothetical protein